MKAYELASGAGIDGLRHVDRSTRTLGVHEVRVRIGAAALNFRDLMFADGKYGVPAGTVVVPLSDGAGEVIETGGAVTRVEAGDHVMPGFWPHWIDGDIGSGKTDQSFGTQADGTLTEDFVADEQTLTIAPAGLSSAETAALPCAGLTAWNALFVRGALKPGATVLLLGTGGGSIWALQLARAAGLRPIVTSSSDEKLERARQLGAVETINYRSHPEWQEEVKRLTDDRGVDLVLEVGGKGTMPRSIEAVRIGGTVVVVIGGVGGGEGGGIEPRTLIVGAKTLSGIMVGSRAMLEDLVRFVETTGIRPIIDRSFPFEAAAAAYHHMRSGQHFGKIVVDIGGLGGLHARQGGTRSTPPAKIG